MFYHQQSPWDIFADFRRPSVYVISDSEMKRFKEKNTRAEIAELERIVAEREQSIVTLKATIEDLKKELPALPETPQAA